MLDAGFEAVARDTPVKAVGVADPPPTKSRLGCGLQRLGASTSLPRTSSRIGAV